MSDDMEDYDDYDFDYDSDDDDVGDQDVEIENMYYNSKGILAEQEEGYITAALQGFQDVVNMQANDKGEWGFRALKQVIKIHFKLDNVDDMMEAYREMLNYVKSNAVTKNQSEKKINSLLDFISQSTNIELLQRFYETTLQALEETQNERLWFKTNLKLCYLYFQRSEFAHMAKLLKVLKSSCQKEDGTSDMKKGTQLLEIYAIEIQMYTRQKNNKKLKELYQDALRIKSAIPHPKIMGIIRECGGKMHMHDELWEQAATDFFEAFKNFDEAGATRKIQCLKYLVLATMLMESNVDPFTAQESQPYKNDPEVAAMTALVEAYQNNNIKTFEKILKTERKTIMDDPFIRNYIEDLLRKIRTQVLLKLIQPYTQVRLPFISKKLNIPECEVEQLLVSLILDNRITGHVDQVNAVLELGDETRGTNRYSAIDKWATQLGSLHKSVVHRLQW